MALSAAEGGDHPPGGGGGALSRGRHAGAEPARGIPGRGGREDEQGERQDGEQNEAGAPWAQARPQRDANSGAHHPAGRSQLADDDAVPVAGPVELIHQAGHSQQQHNVAERHP